jgi:DNA repair exonuclease SbcCD ATPase subunit
LSLNISFAHEVGFLCLDEPTTGLDADRKTALRQTLLGLRELCGSRGLQCVVVTHERGLASAADAVIDLGVG